jgi:hypothetical protein
MAGAQGARTALGDAVVEAPAGGCFALFNSGLAGGVGAKIVVGQLDVLLAGERRVGGESAGAEGRPVLNVDAMRGEQGKIGADDQAQGRSTMGLAFKLVEALVLGGLETEVSDAHAWMRQNRETIS